MIVTVMMMIAMMIMTEIVRIAMMRIVTITTIYLGCM